MDLPRLPGQRRGSTPSLPQDCDDRSISALTRLSILQNSLHRLKSSLSEVRGEVSFGYGLVAGLDADSLLAMPEA
jgi:hypothetical protein